MKDVYICACCGFVSTRLSEFKIVGHYDNGEVVYSCKDCRPLSQKTAGTK